MKEIERNKYLIEKELEELDFLIIEFVKISNFYFERYGFGSKVTKPSIAYKFDKDLESYKEKREKLI